MLFQQPFIFVETTATAEVSPIQWGNARPLSHSRVPPSVNPGSLQSDPALTVQQFLEPVMTQIDLLSTLSENWNYNGAAKPKPAAISAAREWISLLFEDVSESALKWSMPHVTADEAGDVVFEWWLGNRKLTSYVSATTASYLKVWGPSIDTEMVDGSADTKDARIDAWQWLTIS